MMHIKNEGGKMKDEERRGKKNGEGAGFSGRGFIVHFSLFIFHLLVLLSCASPVGEEGAGNRDEKIPLDRQGVLDVTAYRIAPRTGERPVQSFVASAFSGIVNWTEGDRGVTGVFRAGASYTAVATLSALPGYTFWEPEGDSSGNHDTVTVTIAFENAE
jgi:hypothetical protein